MGQAKRRGTFEQRKQAAIEAVAKHEATYKEEMKQLRANAPQLNPSMLGGSRVNSIMMAGLVFAATGWDPRGH